MRYVPAVLWCSGVLVVYALLGVVFDWRHGGGLIPSAIFLLVIAGVWQAAKPKE